MLLTQVIEVRPFKEAKHYESLGYILERHKVGSHRKLMVPRKFLLDVKVEHLPRTSSLKVQYCCDKCKNNFVTSYNNYNKSKKAYGDLCRKCATKSTNYNENLTDEFRIERRLNPEDLIWKKEVYKRDNYKCTICITQGSRLEAHHLNGYTEFKDERHNIENGITLCRECHKSYHKAFGYKNSTKEKFEQFKKELECILFN